MSDVYVLNCNDNDFRISLGPQINLQHVSSSHRPTLVEERLILYRQSSYPKVKKRVGVDASSCALWKKGGCSYHEAIVLIRIATCIPGIPKGQMKWLKCIYGLLRNNYQDPKTIASHLCNWIGFLSFKCYLEKGVCLEKEMKNSQSIVAFTSPSGHAADKICIFYWSYHLVSLKF